MNIASVNLNLFLAFEALLEERNVSRAAARVGLSQPAMSNALAKLREIFEDRLFTRTRQGMLPTARALELASSIRGGLAQFRGVLQESAPFDPATSTRSFTMAMTDYAEIMVLGPLLRLLRRTAPNMQVVVRRSERLFVPPQALLHSGKLDAAVGFFPDETALDPGIHSTELFAENNVCIARKGHRLMRGRFGLREFAEADHLGIFYSPDTRGLIDNLLATHGLRRRLCAATPHFLTAGYLVAQSDLLAVVPAGLAAYFRKLVPLAVRPVPLELPLFRMRLLWHQRLSADAAYEWLRPQIAAHATRERTR